ncbi:scarecrow-like protein 34 [Curcuma longa]|uniref:scarecrow-like protein 34 n=1 Tax=Curcuma longa TaxID=136217 RepID=UPI003D9E70AE
MKEVVNEVCPFWWSSSSAPGLGLANENPQAMDSGIGDLRALLEEFDNNQFFSDPSTANSFKVKGPQPSQPAAATIASAPNSVIDLPNVTFLQTPSAPGVSATAMPSFSSLLNGEFCYDHLFSQENAFSNVELGGQQQSSNQSMLFDLASVQPSSLPSVSNPVSHLAPPLVSGSTVDSPDDSEFSDIVVRYMQMLMEEGSNDDKFDTFSENPALLAVEKPFHDILDEKVPTSIHKPPLFPGHVSDSPDGYTSDHHSNSTGSGNTAKDNGGSCDEHAESSQSQINPVVFSDSLQSTFFLENSFGNTADGMEKSFLAMLSSHDFLAQNQSDSQFRKGFEEGQKFLPSKDKLVIDLGAEDFRLPQVPKKGKQVVEVKKEDKVDENQVYSSRGKKNPHGQDVDLEAGRSNKQSAIFSDDSRRTDMLDEILLSEELCVTAADKLKTKLQNEANKASRSSNSKGSSSSGKSRGRTQSKREVVDLRTLLIHCAQAVAAGDPRNANELLKQIRQHSSPEGDANERLAHYFANGLQARLAGTGSQIYHSLTSKRYSVTDILKAYQLYTTACPFRKLSHFFSTQTILDVAEKATKLHIIDFGIYYGLQWPCFLQRLSYRGRPPKVRITGIDTPVAGFRPAELIDETGRRLADYARSFNIPFEYRSIASAKWETIRAEDLHLQRDEVLVVNCFYRFKSLMDETVVVDNPRDMVLNNIRRMNPDVFIHGIVNGTYSAPFFVTRFREALFHYSSVFDMIETNVVQKHESRQLIESVLFGREALNIIACEGTERMERPETYKQWSVRNLRAGFMQLPLNRDIMKKAKDKVKACYNKDFVVDEDSKWMLQGWKGRIIYALSSWKPNIFH